MLKENYILLLKDGVSYGRVQYSDCRVYAIEGLNDSTENKLALGKKKKNRMLKISLSFQVLPEGLQRRSFEFAQIDIVFLSCHLQLG